MPQEHVSSRDLQKGSAEMLVLALVEEQQRHGYEIAQLIEQRSNGEIRFRVPSLYPLLYRLERRGLVEGRWVEKSGLRRRRFYRITPAGRKALAAQRRGWKSCSKRSTASPPSAMPDWRGYVAAPAAARLPAGARGGDRRGSRAAAPGHYSGALSAGASAAEADARVRDEIHDWRALARDLQHAEQPILAAPKTIAVHRLEPAMHRFNVGLRLLEILRDARLSVRALMARPLFTLTTVMTFALGIGATTVVFSLVHSVLLSPLPYREPDRLTFVQQVIPEIADRVPILGVNPRSFTSWERACKTPANRWRPHRVEIHLTGLGEPEGLIGARISPALFDLLGMPASVWDGPSPERKMRRAGTGLRSSRTASGSAGSPAIRP